ncbi:MAG: hypothetical protein R3C44_09260 [Chloroflexota bacterium]
MELIGITARLYFVDGVAQDTDVIPGLLAQTAPPKSARGREHDYLFAHLSLSGPPDEAAELADSFVATLTQEFFHSTGTVTAALRRAVLDMNERLLYYNVQNRRAVEGALTAAVLHGDELFTLQTGEALAYLGHNFGVERLPTQTTGAPTPLGRSAGLDIRFAYHRLQIGDMLLLADPRLASLNGSTLSPVLVDSEIESGVDALAEVIDQDTARLLLVEFADEIPASLPVKLVPKPAKPATRPAPVPVSKEPAPAPPTAGPQRESGLPPLRTTAAPAITTATVETKARQAAASSARGMSSATGWLSGMLGQLNPTSDDKDDEETSISWALPAAIALLIPLIVSGIVLSVYLQRGNVEELGQIKQDMVEHMVVAEGAADSPEQSRASYEAVLALAAAADELRPGDGEIARMRFEARENLDRMDGVTRLTATAFGEYGKEATLTNLALRDAEGGFYVLDETGNEVLFRETDENYDTINSDDPQIVAYNGQAVGTEIMGPVLDMIWRSDGSAETRSGLTMLDRTGVLFTYYPNLGDIRAVPLGFSSNWLNPVAISTYGGRIYILDNGAGQIWKYYPQGEGFIQDETDIAISLDEGADLQQAVDFDLYSEDGSLAVLYSDGRIRYYDTRSGRIQWDENTLLQNGLTTPFVSPTAVELVGRGLNASIFVLDPGTSRLVQISRGGTVLAQYRALDDQGNELLSQATDFGVAESPFRLLLTTSTQVFRASR